MTFLVVIFINSYRLIPCDRWIGPIILDLHVHKEITFLSIYLRKNSPGKILVRRSKIGHTFVFFYILFPSISST